MGLRVLSQKFGLRELCLGGLILRRRGEDVKEIRSAVVWKIFELWKDRRSASQLRNSRAKAVHACGKVPEVLQRLERSARSAEKIPRQVARNSDR